MPLRPKAPEDCLDFAIELPPAVVLLSGETLTAGTVTPAPAGLTVNSVAPSATGLVAWLQGGAAQTLYALACSATTSQGRVVAWSSSIYVGTSGLDDPSPIAPTETGS